MDMLLTLINAGVCGAIALALCYVILTPRVRDSLIVKIGLCSMALGFGSIGMRLTFDPTNAQGLERSLLLINAGLAVAIIGYLLRRSRNRCQMRRSSDWLDKGDTP